MGTCHRKEGGGGGISGGATMSVLYGKCSSPLGKGVKDDKGNVNTLYKLHC